MSEAHVAAVLERSQATGTARMLLLAIAAQVPFATGAAVVPVNALMGLIRKDRRTVQIALSQLEALEELWREPVTLPKHIRRANRLHILIPVFSEAA